ncbi:signal peptidase II [Peptoanaerobacter stomatis]|uniref:Lipoprotein signal peptidase n=1 Tax=Peptoanaerobacter stomatis TaxID=796937 RepID=J6HPU0_9FIRM|nr:signal peptidase II [Peptoanaerobacter stomatis]EJU24278.1 signal peptidase II [Peptoanaerobacter stomatis]NWO25212.1 signal peptidase II [Peptostreptococcaceae bacterium oral taxon 081]
MNKIDKKSIFYIILGIFLLIIDQIVKINIKNNMAVGDSIKVVNDFFSITYVQNKGAAFGILQNQKFLFLIIGIVMILGLIYMFIKDEDKITRLSISMIISGALGNIVDRLRYGYVVDMFDFHTIWSYVFNVADICVVLGIILMSIRVFTDRRI